MNKQSDLQRMTQMASTLGKIMQDSNDSSQDLLKTYMEEFMGVDNYDEMNEQEVLEKAMEAFQHLVGNFQQLSVVTKKLENEGSPVKAGSNSRPGTGQRSQDLDFRLMKTTLSSIVRIQAWWRQKMAIRMLEVDMKQARDAFNTRRQNETPEESALREFATQLSKKNLTPEAFFRFCDPDYKMAVEVSVFKTHLTKLGLQLSRGQISRMMMILDEELQGVIKREDYYDTLETYSVAGEKHKNVDGSPYYPFENRALFKLMIELAKKDISHIEMFNACDINDDSRLDINELKKFVEGLSTQFSQKEIFTLMNYLDIDKNGIVEKDEFIRRMKKGEQSYKQSIVVAKQASEKKMLTSTSQNQFYSSKVSQQNYEAQENNFFDEDEVVAGDQNMASDFFNKAKQTAVNTYQKVSEVIDKEFLSSNDKTKQLSPDEQKRAQIIQKMEREGQRFDSFFQQLKSQSVAGKLNLGIVLKGLEISYPTITSVDRNFLIRDCIIEKTKIDYLILEELFTKFSKKLKPSVAQAFQVIATNIVKRMGGDPQSSIRQYFKAQNVSENDVLSDMEFSIMFSGKFSNLSQRDLDQAFNSLNLDMDGFVHVRDLIEVLLSYSSPQEKNATAVNDLNSVIPGFESMSPRTRSQEVIEYLINELEKKNMAPINVYKMADAKNSGSVSVQVIEATLKKFLPHIKNEVFQEAINAFGQKGPRDLIIRKDFEDVFTPSNNSQKGGYIPNSTGIGKKLQGNNSLTNKETSQDEATISIRKLDEAMLQEGISPSVAFKAADLNHNGVVTVDELREMFKKLIPDEVLSLAELKKIMMAFDINKNGLIEEKEFIDAISKARNSNVTIIESPQKNKSGVGLDIGQRRSQLPLKETQSNKGKSSQDQDDSLLALQIDQLDTKVNLKAILAESILNEEGQITINSIGRRLKQESTIKPSDYLPMLKVFDSTNSGLVSCRDVLKFCEKYCKSNSTNYTLEVKWIANVIEYQKRNRNTKQYFETNTKMRSGSRLMEVELMSELQNNFGISMQAGRLIYRGISQENGGGDLTLEEFCNFIDQHRQVAVADTSKQSSTSASKLNVDIISAKFWVRVCGLLPKRKDQFDTRVGQVASDQGGQVDYKNFYEIMVNEFELITIPESKALFEYFKQKGSLKNAIEVDVIQQEISLFLIKLRQSQLTAIAQAVATQGPKFQEGMTKLKMNEHGYISKNDLRTQLQTLSVINKRGENLQDSKYATTLKRELNLSNEFELPAQVQSYEAFDQIFQDQMENCQFWAVINFLGNLTSSCCDELIFKYLGKIFDQIVPNKESSSLLQQAVPNTSVISNANELVGFITKIQEFVTKKVKAISHGDIAANSGKMLLQLWPILGGKPIKISNSDDIILLQKINRHRAALPSGSSQKDLSKSELLQSSINQRGSPLKNNENLLIIQLEDQMGMPFEDAVDMYLLEDMVPVIQFIKKLSETSTNVDKELLRSLCRDIDTEGKGKLFLKDLIFYLKHKTSKYNKEETLAQIAQEVEEPVGKTLQKHGFYENDIVTLQDFYSQLTQISTVTKLQGCALYYDLVENNDDSFSIQVNKFIEEVTDAKKQPVRAGSKQPTINKKTEIKEVVSDQIKNQEEEEIKKPKLVMMTKVEAVQSIMTKTQLIDRDIEKIQRSKELCGQLVDMWLLVYKPETIKSALLKLNKNLSVSVGQATLQLDPKNEGKIPISKLYKQLGLFANLIEVEKIALSFLPLNYCKASNLMIIARDYVKLIRQINPNTEIKPYCQALKKVYLEIKKEVEDERDGKEHESEEEEKKRDNNVKTKLKDLLSQLTDAMLNEKLNKALEDYFNETDDGKVDYYDFREFLTSILKIQAPSEKLSMLCREIDIDGENSITAQALIQFCEEFKINFSMETSKFYGNQNEEEYNEEGETLYCDDLVYKIVPKVDFFRENVPTILNSEEAALVMAEKLYKKIPKGQSFFDFDFGPKNENDTDGNKFSLYATGEPPANYVKPQDIQWIGPEEWSRKRPQFLVGGSESSDVQQGNIGDCWFISALSVLATRDELLRGGVQNMDIKKGMKITKDVAEDLCSGVYPPIFHIYRNKGLYVFRFFKDFQWRYVIIDKRIPSFKSNSEPVFGRCIDIWETWVPLIEKAYAKLNGCYESLISGFIDDALNEMTGLVAEKIKVTDPKTGLISSNLGTKDEFWQFLLDRKKEDCMMGCSIVGGTEEKFKINGRPCGVITGHAYAILDVFELKDNQRSSQRKSHRIMVIRNPWGNTEWNGKWSDSSSEVIDYRPMLDKYNASLKPDDRFKIGQDDGTFLMNYQSWRDVFNNMFVCVDFPSSWSALRINSKWDNTYCGGLPSPATQTSKLNWATKNPQFYISPSTDIELFVSLAQPDGRAKRPDGKYFKFPYSEAIHPVQFTICELKDPNQKRIQVFDTSNQIFRSIVKEYRDIQARIKLPKGRYSIVCSTRNANETGPFTLSLYFNAEASSVKLQDLQNKNNIFKPILEEQENNNKVQPWKKDLCKKRLEFMINDEDDEIGDIPDDSMEKSFLGSQTVAMEKFTSDVKIQDNKTQSDNKIQSNNKPAEGASDNINKLSNNSKNVQPIPSSKNQEDSKNTSNKQPASKNTVNTKSTVVNTKTNQPIKNTQPVKKSQPTNNNQQQKNNNNAAAGPSKKVGFQKTEDFE